MTHLMARRPSHPEERTVYRFVSSVPAAQEESEISRFESSRVRMCPEPHGSVRVESGGFANLIIYPDPIRPTRKA